MSNSLWQSDNLLYTFQFRLRASATFPTATDASEYESIHEPTTNSNIADDLDWRIARLDFDNG
jgi:hypothetical protein